MKTLLNNNPIVGLTEETDYFGLIAKGNSIRDFLINTIDDPLKFKMLCIYGNWGSGKSTLMTYLMKELDTYYNCYFFESWEYEKDENLAYSLLEFFTSNATDPTDNNVKQILSLGKRILKGLGKGITLNIPVQNASMKVSTKEIIEEIQKKEDTSFHSTLLEFKKKFKAIENRKNKTNKFNIIFIDDLDRCEPEQILNLLSAIKLFFTYGERTIFFCGIDRNAVESAVLNKYGNHIKAKEYLEKIFDFSFTMPHNIDFSKLINVYFTDQPVRYNGTTRKLNELIVEFLTEIKFTTPRKLKKVMNSFSMLKLYLDSNLSENSLSLHVANGNSSEGFQIILCLYLIILKEFYYVEFDHFLNFDRKRSNYLEHLNDKSQRQSILNIINGNYSKLSFKDLANNHHFEEPNLFICLSPYNVQSVGSNSFFVNHFSSITMYSETIDYLFYKFVNKSSGKEIVAHSESMASIYSIKKTIEDFL